MKLTASQIAEITGGSIEGDSKATVSKLSKIEEGEKDSLSFLSNPKYTPYIYKTRSSIVLVNNDLILDQQIKPTLIRVENSYEAFSKLLDFYQQMKSEKEGIETPSFVSEGATHGKKLYLGAFSYINAGCKIGNNVKIYPQVYIGDNVTIGDNTIVFSGAKIHSDSVIGSDCIIHSNVIIGSDGFGFSPSSEGNYTKVPQTGNVIIEDHVEIGAGTTIDRATLGATIIRRGVKLDNLIQIAHNVEVGEHSVIAAQAGIAGSSKIGRHCMIGGQAGIAGHLVIGDRVQIQGQSGVLKNLKDDSVVQGTPAIDFKRYSKSYVHFRNLTTHINELNQLKKKSQ
jgi:UDP-3-O-[3-hydroxymyristoyl] glucosamine N-acyltransferase